MKIKNNEINKKVYFLFILITCINLTAIATNLDTTYGINNTGITTLRVNIESQIHSIKLQSDGKVIAAGSSTNGSGNNFTLARFTKQGILDTTFNSTGQVVTAVGSNSQVADIAIQNDGKIVASGFSFKGTNNFTLVRYTTSGSLDTTFGTNGIVITSINNGAFAQSVKIQTDGKIVVGGYSLIGVSPNFALARYNSNGSIDTGFNGNGIVTTLIGQRSTINSIAIQSDGKIVVGGSGTDINITNQFSLARYNTNGTIDTTFGNNGFVITSTGNQSIINSIAIQANGKIIAAGTLTATNQILLTRYNTNGTLDSSFGTNGKVIMNVANGCAANSVTIQTDQKIVVGGAATQDETINFALLRFNSTGSLDTTFGHGGILVIPINNSATVNSVLVQTDGKIVAGGFALTGQFNRSQFALARINKNNTDFVTIQSIANASIIGTRRPTISGIASANNVEVDVSVDGSLFTTGLTNSLGNWNVGQTNILGNGTHIVQSNLIVSGINIADDADQFVVSATDSVSVKSPGNKSIISSHTPTISGISTLANTDVVIFLDGAFFNLVTTDSFGNWNAGATSHQPSGSHGILAVLVNGAGNMIATATCKFTIS